MVLRSTGKMHSAGESVGVKDSTVWYNTVWQTSFPVWLSPAFFPDQYSKFGCIKCDRIFAVDRYLESQTPFQSSNQQRQCSEGKSSHIMNFYPHHAMLAWVLAVIMCVCVCLSVTHQCCIEMVARIELIFCVHVSLDPCYSGLWVNLDILKSKDTSPRTLLQTVDL